MSHTETVVRIEAAEILSVLEAYSPIVRRGNGEPLQALAANLVSKLDSERTARAGANLSGSGLWQARFDDVERQLIELGILDL